MGGASTVVSSLGWPMVSQAFALLFCKAAAYLRCLAHRWHGTMLILWADTATPTDAGETVRSHGEMFRLISELRVQLNVIYTFPQ